MAIGVTLHGIPSFTTLAIGTAEQWRIRGLAPWSSCCGIIRAVPCREEKGASSVMLNCCFPVGAVTAGSVCSMCL